jgi:hypothetical protein
VPAEAVGSEASPPGPPDAAPGPAGGEVVANRDPEDCYVCGAWVQAGEGRIQRNDNGKWQAVHLACHGHRPGTVAPPPDPEVVRMREMVAAFAAAQRDHYGDSDDDTEEGRQRRIAAAIADPTTETLEHLYRDELLDVAGKLDIELGETTRMRSTEIVDRILGIEPPPPVPLVEEMTADLVPPVEPASEEPSSDPPSGLSEDEELAQYHEFVRLVAMSEPDERFDSDERWDDDPEEPG